MERQPTGFRTENIPINVLREMGTVNHDNREYKLLLIEIQGVLGYALRCYDQEAIIREFLFEVEKADAIGRMIFKRSKKVEMSEARKHWTKIQVNKHLGTLLNTLKELEKISSGAGQMPAPLRRKVTAIHTKVNSLVAELQAWDITPGAARQQKKQRSSCRPEPPTTSAVPASRKRKSKKCV